MFKKKKKKSSKYLPFVFSRYKQFVLLPVRKLIQRIEKERLEVFENKQGLKKLFLHIQLEQQRLKKIKQLKIDQRFEMLREIANKRREEKKKQLKSKKWFWF